MILRKAKIASEQDLIQRCITGDQRAQFALYSKYADAMLNVAHRIMNNREDARDVLQEAFIKAFTRLESFRFQSTFGAWLKRIVVNTAINYNKKKGLMPTTELEDNIINLHEGPVGELNLEMDIKKVNQALLDLPYGYRTVLSLYLIEGYDHGEISEILNISKSTSLTQYKRGKARLKALIHKMNQDGSD